VWLPYDGRIETTRIDRWLWAVRLYPTRSAATTACRGGHVRVNGSPAKASAPVRAGDRVDARIHGQDRVLEIVRLIDKRVGAPLAAECLIDSSPPLPTKDDSPVAFDRERGAGRPTKRDRRDLDRLRGRSGD
jgi:ribosome-associated heat shock protein Hsp15